VQAPGSPEEVPIAVLAPMTKLIGLPGAQSPNARAWASADRLAVQLAVKHVNERGGFSRSQAPFVLASNPKGYARYGWGLPEDDLSAYALEHGVFGLVGRLSPEDRLTSFVTWRTEVPLINAATTTVAFPERINPQVFRCPSNDPQRHELVLDYVFNRLGISRVAILRSASGIAQVHLDWWSRHARRRGHQPVADVFLNPDATDLGPQLRALQRAKPEAVLTWCDARMSAGMLRLLHKVGLRPVFVGSGQIICEAFVRLAGEDPGEVIAVHGCDHQQDGDAAARFAEAYTRQHPRLPANGRPPPEAYFSYDAARHLMEAINLAGLDREAIREALIEMDDAVLARLEDGEWKICRRSDL
jgi:branched-chain amino acid transport system substrate-binding protein